MIDGGSYNYKYMRRSNEHRVYFQMCSLIRLYKFLIPNF